MPAALDKSLASDLSRALSGVWAKFRGRLASLLSETAARGADLLIGQLTDDGEDAPDLPPRAITALAEKQADDAIAAIDATTLKRLAAGEDAFADAPDRADLIAETETAGAYHGGMLAAAQSRGGMLKQWVTDGEGACGDCVAAEDAGPIELDDDWDGLAAPPSHPGCRCGVAYLPADVKSLHRKYNPDQPRVPAGSSDGGEFGAGGGRGGSGGGEGPSESAADIDAINRWVNNPGSVTPEDRQALDRLASTSQTARPRLERIYRDDPKMGVGDVVDLPATAFTGVAVSEGKEAGNIGWKSNDGALAVIESPRRGYDIPYDKVNAGFDARSEKETLVAGRYRVKEIRKVTEPGTKPQDGYTVKQYVLEEVGGTKALRRKGGDVSGEARDDHGQWTAGGRPGGGAAEEPEPAGGKADEFAGDPKREAARAFAADVNQRVKGLESDAATAQKSLAKDATTEYARLQEGHADTPEGRAVAAAVDHVNQWFGPLQAEPAEAETEAAVGRAIDSLPEHERALAEPYREAIAERLGTGDTPDYVKAVFSDEDCDRAAEHAVDRQLEATRDMVESSDLAEILRDNGGDASASDLADHAEEWLADRKQEALNEAIDAVQAGHRPYIDAHAGRIDDAFEDKGRINADRVFAEDDNGTTAVPHATAVKYIDAVNQQYQGAVAEHEAAARQVAAKAAEAYGAALKEAIDAGREDDFDADAVAGKAVADAVGELPKHLRDAVEQAQGDNFRDALPNYDRVPEDWLKDPQTIGPDDDRRAELAEQAVKSARKGIKGAAGRRIRDEEDGLIDRLNTDEKIPHDYFDEPYKP